MNAKEISKAAGNDPQPTEVRNPDRLTGEPGAHPVGTGVGATLGGAATGAAIGALAGPLGTVAGAVVGGVAGAAVGKAIAENINPTLEESYWRSTYTSRPYYRNEFGFDDYLPAFRIGWESYDSSDRTWEEREPELRKKWDEARWEGEGGAPKMNWDEARAAARDAFQRVSGREPQADRSSSDANRSTARK